MMMSTCLRASTARASLRGGASLPKLGALPPMLEVVKNTGSISGKSFSSRMRCISTEPTMPRHPTKPTFFIVFHLLIDDLVRFRPALDRGLGTSQRGDHRVAHLP